jgi:hypothetical protein
MLEQQNFQFSPEYAPRRTSRTRLLEYAGLLALFLKLYFQARLLMAQNYLLSCRLQLCELPLIYLKIEIFIVRLSLGFPLAQCWPVEKPSSINNF